MIISEISENELKFFELMQDEFMMDLEYRAPASILVNRPNYRCPLCSTEMMIAGKINRDYTEERAEGKTVVPRYTCHGCMRDVIPIKIQ